MTSGGEGELGEGGVAPAAHKGELGEWLASRLVAAFGYYPSLVLVWVVTFGSLLPGKEKAGSHVIPPSWRPDGIKNVDVK